ncbi:hypothetical protein BK744_08920 [Bacillus thuringiensis serovar zhaodongensis]|uniref:hypothetical protein n=1 Tax=Bacillus thuringiensis TaxID=1428 RepID=UPI000A383672|nr:hypothetical protein [Bacillus thuringiensis]OUB77477.1 hypothetical protein BK744_08920 [Bacillus thuringiensis serovar zhaodongensis]
MGNTYELLAVRYRENEEDGTKRREFFPFQAEEAKEFYNELKEKNYAFVELTPITAYRSLD